MKQLEADVLIALERTRAMLAETVLGEAEAAEQEVLVERVMRLEALLETGQRLSRQRGVGQHGVQAPRDAT